MSLWQSVKQGWRDGARLSTFVDSLKYEWDKNVTIGRFKNDDIRDTAQLYHQAQQLYNASPLAEIELSDFAYDLVYDAIQYSGRFPIDPVVDALIALTEQLMAADGLTGVPPFDPAQPLEMSYAVGLRNYYRQQIAFFSNYEQSMATWRDKLMYTFAGFIQEGLPANAFSNDDNDDDAIQLLETSLIDLVDDPADVVERFAFSFFSDDVIRANHFSTLREQLDLNVYYASGIDPNKESSKPIIKPSEQTRYSPSELAELYLARTPLLDLLTVPLPFSVPASVRFEHTHILAGTGHGKTQLLQHLIWRDLERAQQGKCGFAVIDSQGDLIRLISQQHCFSPTAKNSLADQFIYIDPTDLEHPPCLNMFDLGLDQLAEVNDTEREQLINSAISLYQFMFGSLLETELMARQQAVIRNTARLMMSIPEANVFTFYEFLLDPENDRYQPYFKHLDDTTRDFFERRFFTKTYKETREQVVYRLDVLFSSSIFSRIFKNARNKVNLAEAMNSGKIILINTSKDVLQDDSPLFGRLFIALLLQAGFARASIPEEKRAPFFVYIDEADDYFDQSGQLATLFTRIRKYKVGCILSHQDMTQIRDKSSKLEQAVLGCTNTKMLGGITAKDIDTLSKEINCDPDELRRAKLRKAEKITEFAVHVKNHMSAPAIIEVPLGFMNEQPRLSADEYRQLLAANRRRVSLTAEEKQPTTPSKATPKNVKSFDSNGNTDDDDENFFIA